MVAKGALRSRTRRVTLASGRATQGFKRRCRCVAAEGRPRAGRLLQRSDENAPSWFRKLALQHWSWYGLQERRPGSRRKAPRPEI